MSNLSLIFAFVSAKSEILGSWMNDFPPFVWGGKLPLVIVRRHSIIVVFPAPFGPRIIVSGF